MSESKKRSIIKTIIWRIVCVFLTLVISYIFTHSISQSLGITIVGNIASMILYFIHERLWAKINWGYEDGKMEWRRRYMTKIVYAGASRSFMTRMTTSTAIIDFLSDLSNLICGTKPRFLYRILLTRITVTTLQWPHALMTTEHVDMVIPVRYIVTAIDAEPPSTSPWLPSIHCTHHHPSEPIYTYE